VSRISAFQILLLASALQACSMLGGGEETQQTQRRHADRAAGHSLNADCERLAPFVVNTEGTLSKPDLEAGLKTEFAKWDKNGDGQLSQAEVEPLNDHLRSLNVGASPVMDWNGDGKVSYDEFAGGWRTMFDLCSHGDTGLVTKADLERSPSVAPPRPDDDTNKRPEGASSPTAGGNYP
jgi:hypothetical protein